MSVKRDIFRRMAAWVLIVPVLVGTLGFNIDMHFCKGQIKSLRLYGEAHQCVAMENAGGCSSSDDLQLTSHKKKCCADAQIVYRSTFESHSAFEVKMHQGAKTAPYYAVFTQTWSHTADAFRWLDCSEPVPLPPGKKYALLETFLI